MERKLKGSYTVEVALLSGVWLFIIFAALLLLIGTYQNVWDTAGACEIAVHGSTLAVCRAVDGVEKVRGSEKAAIDRLQVSGNSREITVSFDKYLRIPFGNLNWRRKGIVKSKVIKPVLFLEKVQKAKRLLGK